MRIHGTTFRPVEQLHVVREHRGSDRSLVLYHLLQRHPRSELFHRQRRTLPRVVARRGARMGGRSPVPARLLLFLPDAALRSGCPFGRGCRRFQRPRASRARPQSVGRMRGLGGGGVPQSRGRSAAYAAGFLFGACDEGCRSGLAGPTAALCGPSPVQRQSDVPEHDQRRGQIPLPAVVRRFEVDESRRSGPGCP